MQNVSNTIQQTQTLENFCYVSSQLSTSTQLEIAELASGRMSAILRNNLIIIHLFYFDSSNLSQ